MTNPVILKRPEHNISRRKIDPNALKVMYRLHNHGYKAFLVGGGVRDLLLSKTPKDFDIATDARPSQVKKLFANSRIVGRRFRLAHIMFRGGQVIEVSTFRKQSEFEPTDEDDQVVWSENTYGTPEEDANRRDLTINGMFYNIADYSVLDYVGGLEDLNKGIIRVIGDARVRLQEDPVRMIRVIRHAARTGFKIEKSTLDMIYGNPDMITLCPAPRIREEFMRELRGGWSTESFRTMIDTGLLYHLFPPYREALEGRQAKTVLDHLMLNLTGLDKIINSGKIVNDQELLAVLVSPLMHHFEVLDNLPEGRYAATKVSQRIRDLIRPQIRDAGFSRGYAEAACFMLFAQFILKQALERGKLPKSLSRKNYFGPGLRLYQIEAAGKGEGFPKMFLEAAKSKEIALYYQPKSGPRRRRKRPPRKRSAGNGE